MADDMAKVLADILPAPETTNAEAKPDSAPKAPEGEAKGQTQETKPEAVEEAKPEGDAELDDEGTDDEDEGDGKPKPKPGSAKLRDKLAKQNEKIARLERELGERQARDVLANKDEQALAKAVEDRIGPAPKREDFESFLDYDVARTAYEVDKRQAVREVRTEATRASQAQEARFVELVDAFQEAEAEARTKIPDYDEVMKRAADIKTEPHVDHLILESDKGPLLKHYLGQRPKVVENLNRMNPLQAAREIGRLEARLSYPQPKTATSAPPPVTPVSGGARVADGSDLDADPSWQKFQKHRYGNR